MPTFCAGHANEDQGTQRHETHCGEHTFSLQRFRALRGHPLPQWRSLFFMHIAHEGDFSYFLGVVDGANCNGQALLLAWVRGSLLVWDGFWSAPWQAGMSTGAIPGYTTLCGNQALERCNGILKKNLPVSYTSMSLAGVSPRLEASFRTLCCQTPSFFHRCDC